MFELYDNKKNKKVTVNWSEKQTKSFIDRFNLKGKVIYKKIKGGK